MSVSWGARLDTTDIAAFYFNLKSKSSFCHYNIRGLTVLVKNDEIKKLFVTARPGRKQQTMPHVHMRKWWWMFRASRSPVLQDTWCPLFGENCYVELLACQRCFDKITFNWYKKLICTEKRNSKTIKFCIFSGRACP